MNDGPFVWPWVLWTATVLRGCVLCCVGAIIETVRCLKTEGK